MNMQECTNNLCHVLQVWDSVLEEYDEGCRFHSYANVVASVVHKYRTHLLGSGYTHEKVDVRNLDIAEAIEVIVTNCHYGGGAGAIIMAELHSYCEMVIPLVDDSYVPDEDLLALQEEYGVYWSGYHLDIKS